MEPGKVINKEILSPSLKKKLDELKKAIDKKIDKAIKDLGLKEGQYEQLLMKYECNYKPKEKNKYPTSCTGGSVCLIIWKRRKLWTCLDPIHSLTFHATADSREEAIMDFMDKYLIYTLQKERKNSTDFNKWYKKYGRSGKSDKNPV